MKKWLSTTALTILLKISVLNKNLATTFQTKEEVKHTVEVLTNLHKEATKEKATVEVLTHKEATVVEEESDNSSDEDSDSEEDNDSEELTKKMNTLKIDDIISYGNKKVGESFEETAIKQYEQMFNVSIEVNTDYVKHSFYESDKHNWLIGGRIDGLLGTDTVIEVKNRMKCFFNTIPIYEQIQLSTYMYAMKLNKSILIEKVE